MTQEAMSKLKKQLNELSDSKDGPVQNETQVDTSLNLSLANFNLSNGGQARQSSASNSRSHLKIDRVFSFLRTNQS